jgi:serine/threonine protein kinase
VHLIGRTYNDIKPENIMLNGTDVILVDFGFCDKYIDEYGSHIEEETVSS